MPIKISNLFTLIAREVSTDAADNMNSIIKIIDKFSFGIDKEQFEKDKFNAGDQHVAAPINYAVATSWLMSEKLPKDTFLTFKVTITDPSGESLGGPEQENLVPAGLNRLNMNFNMQGLPITESGTYTLLAEVQDKGGKQLAAAEYPFDVELNDGPTAG